jgi:hypothetical protein
MKFNPKIPVYGDQSYRGKCPAEDIEQINWVSWLRFNHPQIALTLIHVKGEGKRTPQQIAKEKKMGFQRGPSDLILTGSPSFICELKRADHTKSKWQDGQQEFILQSLEQGAFVCVALGAEGAKLAFNEWLKLLNRL